MPDEIALNAAIDAFSEQAIGSDDGELSRQRSLALRAFVGEILDEAPEGRSQVGDRAVFETIQQVMPSFMRIFAGGDNVVEFDPVGPDDEEVAEQESDYLNYLVQKDNWELTVREWCQDALLSKNAYCLVDMEEKLVPEIERYEGQQETQLAMLLDDDVEVVGQDQYNDPDDDGQLIDPFTQQPIDPQDEASMMGAMAVYEELGQEPVIQYRQLFDIELKRVKAEKKLRFEVLPGENVRVGQDTKDFTLEKCNYFEFWDPTTTISDLRKLGYDVDDDISDKEMGYTQEDDARDTELEGSLLNESPDKSMRQVTMRTIWIRYDYDEDGIAELQKVVRVGDTILDHEPASRIPVACITPFINTHRHIGISVADLVFDVQRIKTSLLRSGLDSLNLSTRPQHAVSNKVTLDDMLTNVPGGIKRVDTDLGDVQGHIVPLVTQDTFPSAQAGMQHMNTVIEARVGVNNQFSGIDAGAMSGNNQHDVIGQLSTMAAQRIEDIARLFGSGFKRLFSLAHELVIKSGHQAETVKLRGKWVELDPGQWRTGRDMRVVAPFAAGNKDSLVQRIMVHMQVHEKALAGGLPIVDVQDAYNLALELAKATDLPGTKIYTDPSTVEPKQPGPDHTMLALQIEDKKAENEATDEARKAELEKYKAELQAEVDKYKADLASQTQIAIANAAEGRAINLEQVKANLKNAPIELGNDAIKAQSQAVNQLAELFSQSMNEVSQAMSEIKATAEAPIKIVRDKGKIVGKEVNGKFIPLEDV